VTISVILATRNRAPVLASTLEALEAQEPPPAPWEVVVVDNHTVDHTAEMVQAAVRRARVPVVYLRETKPGKSHALNTGIRRAKGDLLVLTDDDVLPSPGWLRAYARAFTEHRADYAAGRILPLWEAPPPRWLSPRLYGVLAVGDGGPNLLPLGRGLNEQIMPIGANMALRREVLERVGGWNPSLGKLQGTLRTGEDHEFALKMVHAGFRGVYAPEAWVRHRVPPDRLRLGYFARWYFDNGAIVAGLDRAFQTGVAQFLGLPRYLWRRVASDALALPGAALRMDAASAAAAVMRIVWFAGYVRGSRIRSAAAPAGHPLSVERS
jgi:glycosyltransferase involved in cell wall biosynthesis